MKFFNATMVCLFLCFALSAQYKKASFFGKEGRTYGLGTRVYALGEGKGSPIGYVLSFGGDQDGKRFFSSWEIQYIPSYKFSFTTTDVNDAPVTVNGQAKTHLIYALNYGFHLLKNDDPEQKIKPYVTAGFNIVILGGLKTIDNYSYDNKMVVSDRSFSAGLGGGAGCFYNFAPRWSLKIEGGYTYQFNADVSTDAEGAEMYHMFTKHPYASAGIRFRLTAD